MKERKPTTSYLALVLAVLVALPPGLWAQDGPQLPDPGSAPFSREQQIEIGKQAVAQVYKQMPVLPDSDPVTQYVQQLGRKLVTVIPDEDSWPYQFHVIQQKEINAFALPGGPIFVNLGTIQAADNEAELVGVMAHEMSHVYMQHSAKAAGKQSTVQGIAGILGAVLGGGAVGGLARAGLSIGAGALVLKYSRHDEAQADHVGAIIMYLAGYNPKAMADFFAKLESEGGSGGPQFLSDHPNPGNREAAIQKEIAGWPQEQYHQDSAAFVQAKAQAAGAKSYSGEQIQQRAHQGGYASQAGSGASGGGSLANVSLPQVMPSGQYRTLPHAGFTLDYPSNWQAFGSRNSAVTIAPSQGISQNAVSYGVILNDFQPQGSSLDSAMQELIANIKQSNPDLRAIGKSQPLKVNGISGRSLEMVGDSPIRDDSGRPLRERDWLVALSRSDGTLLYLVFIAPEPEFDRLRGSFEHMLKSIQLS